MKCPFCNKMESKVIDSRPTDEGERIRRRRECLECGKRFTTYEIIESLPIIVIKKDRSREVFDRNKLLNGVLRACEKRPVSINMLDNMIDEIESTIQNSLDREVSSDKIGELVMDKLKNIDEVAYVRFASVYRQFKDITTFMNELNKLTIYSLEDYRIRNIFTTLLFLNKIFLILVHTKKHEQMKTYLSDAQKKRMVKYGALPIVKRTQYIIALLYEKDLEKAAYLKSVFLASKSQFYPTEFESELELIEIAEACAKEEKIDHMLYYDSLTDLKNRLCFDKELELHLLKKDVKGCFIYINIRRFKQLTKCLAASLPIKF